MRQAIKVWGPILMGVLLLCGMAMILTGCAPTGDFGETVAKERYVLAARTVERIEDQEAGVACWIYRGYGIDCLPMSVTRLEGD